jgi:hypothetical protein
LALAEMAAVCGVVAPALCSPNGFLSYSFFKHKTRKALLNLAWKRNEGFFWIAFKKMLSPLSFIFCKKFSIDMWIFALSFYEHFTRGPKPQN